jgi:tripartite-type tricarboxylate transporter receptor subunit TctC
MMGAAIWKSFLVSAASTALLWSSPAHSDASFPTQPIRIVVPYTPGGTGEMMARLVAERMTESMKHPVLIENRPGGGTTIGAAVVAQAPADGHSVFMNASSFLINAQLMPKLPYDADKDFEPITLAASNPHVLVASPSLGIDSMKAFIEHVKSREGKLTYASFGNGSSGHLAFELLMSTYDLKMVHVPYKGTQQAMGDVMGGQVDAMLADLPASLPHIRAKKLISLGVAADERVSAASDLPTIEETGGKKFTSGSWFGFLVRSGTPPERKEVLHREIVKALKDPDVKEKLAPRSMVTYGTSGDEFAAFMKGESARFAEAIRISGAKID